MGRPICPGPTKFMIENVGELISVFNFRNHIDHPHLCWEISDIMQRCKEHLAQYEYNDTDRGEEHAIHNGADQEDDQAS